MYIRNEETLLMTIPSEPNFNLTDALVELDHESKLWTNGTSEETLRRGGYTTNAQLNDLGNEINSEFYEWDELEGDLS